MSNGAKLFLMLVISVASMVLSLVKLYNHLDDHYGRVSGVIVDKSRSLAGSRYDIHTDYMMAIRPDNPEYNDFDLSVTFSCYSKHEKGDHITFNHIYKSEYIPGWDCLDWPYGIWIFLSIVFVSISLTCIFDI